MNKPVLKRADVLQSIDQAFPAFPMFLTLGGTAREMIAVAGRKGNQLVNLDAMGQTVSVATGMALGLEGEAVGERVVAIEGDGSLIMGLSIISTIGHLKPKNLVIFVLDNNVYLATGGQPTAARDMDFGRVVMASGWAGAREVWSQGDLKDALDWAKTAEGPLLIRVYTTTEQIPTDYFLEDPAVLAEDFRRWLRQSSAT